MIEPLTKEDKQLLSICDDLGRRVSGCEDLLYKYSDFWTPGCPLDIYDWQEIKADIRKMIKRFLNVADEAGINDMIARIHPATKSWLSQPGNLPEDYRYLFRQGRPFATLPNDFVAPNIFLALSHRETSFVPLRRTIKRQYGKTTVELSGCMLSHYDALTLATLIYLKNYKLIDRVGKSISFRTSLEEIAGQMHMQNPWSQSRQHAVWNSLKRLACVVVEITKPSGKRRLGHILGACPSISD